MTMRVFVTGAGGFIGRHLCAELVARGHAVLASSSGADAVVARAAPSALGGTPCRSSTAVLAAVVVG